MFIETERSRFTGNAEPRFHPELRRAALLIPRFSLGRKSSGWLRRMRSRRPVPQPPALPDVAIRDEHIDGPDGNTIRVRIYSPASSAGPRPALLWIHGGGFIIGYPEINEDQNIELCRELGIVVAAVSYRLGPDNPFPAPLDDCHAALAWLHENAGTLGIDKARIAVGGASAGAGIAAGLALLAHDRGDLPIAFQLLVYPMLDDRTAMRTDVDGRWLRVWSAESNRFGWQSYLGCAPGSHEVSAYAAPARRADLRGLPPAWVGVGTCDLFLDEDIAYAIRLNDADVPCDLKIVEGAFHAFDLVAPKSRVVGEFRRSIAEALQANLRPERSGEDDSSDAVSASLEREYAALTN
ncbi:MAG: alpha/beta hydrolase [Novosphingobium sp.]|nr:alpha/beta hydrolase [Novosphingobium sp.]MCP5403600.1 alpha/beta hydrolase [Novosphingobium sp.]